MLQLSGPELIEKQLLDAMESTLRRYHENTCTPDECVASLKEYFDSLTHLVIRPRCVCAWCDRTRTDGGVWLTRASACENVLALPASHTICPDCRESFFEVDALYKHSSRE